MKAESERYLDLLERRLSLLDALSKTLAASRADFVGMDIEAIRERIQEQEDFCKQIRSLDSDITRAQIQCAKVAGVRVAADQIAWPDSQGTDPLVLTKIHGTMRRVANAQAQLKQLNDAHAALLRRSHRTVRVLLNLFQSHAPTYSGQSPATTTGTLCEERV